MIILKVKTIHTGPFKTIIEVLKEIIPETNIEFRNDNATTLSETDLANGVDESSEENDEDVIVEADSDGDDKPVTTLDNAKKDSNDKSGMRIVAVDNSKSVLVNLRLDADKFTKFICNNNRFNVII